MADMQNLTNAVNAAPPDESMKVLLEGIGEMIKADKDNPQELEGLATQLPQKANQFADAVAHEPAEGEATEEPADDEEEGNSKKSKK